MTISTYDRSCKFTELKPYCHHSKEGDFMEVIRWSNEEGFDVAIGEKIYSFTDGQFECLMALVNYKE